MYITNIRTWTEDIVHHAQQKGNINFTTEIEKSLVDCDIIFSCVGTPPKEDGCADLQHVFELPRILVNLLKNMYRSY
jgi:UDPglucose 6-dehydrogenase